MIVADNLEQELKNEFLTSIVQYSAYRVALYCTTNIERITTASPVRIKLIVVWRLTNLLIHCTVQHFK